MGFYIHGNLGNFKEKPTRKTCFSRVCVCVCVCARARARARVCVCVCVCECLSTVKASSVWIRWCTREQINNVMLKMLSSYANSLHCYFRMQSLTFQLAASSCSHTRSGQSHNLTSARLTFRTWGLHSPFRASPSGGTTSWADLFLDLTLTRGFAICLGKTKVTTSISIESSPQQSNEPSPRSFIPVSENVIFHLQRWYSSLLPTRERTIWYNDPAKRWYTDVGCKSASTQNRQVTKRY